MLVIFIVMTIFFKCAVNGASIVLRLKLLRQFGEHLVLDCDLESIVLKLGDLSCVSHFEADLHYVTFGAESLSIPVFLFKAGLELAFVLQLNRHFIAVFKLFPDSQPASYITNNYLPRVWHGVVFVFIVAQQSWHINAAWVVALAEKKTRSLSQPAYVLVASTGFNCVCARDLLRGTDKNDQLHN